MSSGAHEPVSVAEADAVFADLPRFDRLIAAVSGGSDSMALLVLIAEWRARRGNTGPLISVATVDHGLRDASAAEAAFVAEQCARLDLAHATLNWTGTKPARGLAQAARNARYALLEAHALSLARTGTGAVLTAHTEDDQAETFVMRLKRGAGVDGLAAIPRQRALSTESQLALVRPLLGIAKTRLIATLQVRGVPWCEDPTNTATCYERVRVREALVAFKNAGLESAAIATSARRMTAAREALDFATGAFAATLTLSYNSEVFASFDAQAFARGPQLLRERVIGQLIRRFGGATPPPELSEIESLVAHVQNQTKLATTLGGAVVSAGPRTVRVWREAGRLDAAECVLEPGVPLLWDNRFWVMIDAACAARVCVKPLGSEGYRAISAELRVTKDAPAKAVHTLPSFWSGMDLLGVPQLGLYGHAKGFKEHLSARPRADVSAPAELPRG